MLPTGKVPFCKDPAHLHKFLIRECADTNKGAITTDSMFKAKYTSRLICSPLWAEKTAGYILILVERVRTCRRLHVSLSPRMESSSSDTLSICCRTSDISATLS